MLQQRIVQGPLPLSPDAVFCLLCVEHLCTLIATNWCMPDVVHIQIAVQPLPKQERSWHTLSGGLLRGAARAPVKCNMEGFAQRKQTHGQDGDGCCCRPPHHSNQPSAAAPQPAHSRLRVRVRGTPLSARGNFNCPLSCGGQPPLTGLTYAGAMIMKTLHDHSFH